MIRTVLIYLCWKVDVCRIIDKEDMDKRILGALANRFSEYIVDVKKVIFLFCVKMKNGCLIFIRTYMDMSTAVYLFRSENFKCLH